MEQKITMGRIVFYTDHVGVPRPAIVVRVWSPDTGCVNLQVFKDGSNDPGDPNSLAYWATSVLPALYPSPGCWHWPVRE